MKTRSLRSWLFRVISIGSLCCFVASCQFDPWADQFLTKQPSERELIGTYRIDSDTMAAHISGAKAVPFSRDAEIALSAKHEAQFLQVPDFDEHARRRCLINGTGTWQLGRNDDYAVVNVQILRNDFHQFADGCEPTYYGQLMLYGKKSCYKLHITIGDPDSGDAMQFEKIN